VTIKLYNCIKNTHLEIDGDEYGGPVECIEKSFEDQKKAN